MQGDMGRTGIVLAMAASATLGAWRDAHALAPDAFEPDNTPAQASALSPGGTQINHTIMPTNDVDYAAIPMLAGREYQVWTYDLVPTNSQLMMTRLEIHAPDGVTPLTSNELYNVVRSGSMLFFDPEADGTYYAKITAPQVGWPAVDATGTYSLAVADAGAVGEPGTRRLTCRVSLPFDSLALADGTLLAFCLRATAAATNPAIMALTTQGQTNHIWNLPDYEWSSSPPMVGPSHTVYVTGASNIYALAADGTTNRIWQGDSYLAFGGALLGPDETVYAFYMNGQLRALQPDGSTGRVWQLDQVPRGAPVMASDGSLVIGITNKLYTLFPDGSTGSIVQAAAEFSSPLAIGLDGMRYIGAYDSNLYAFTSGGQTAFVWSMGGEMRASPAVAADGTIYLAVLQNNTTNVLYALAPDASTFRQWTFPEMVPTLCGPVLSQDGTIYMSMSEMVYSLDPGGSTNWSRPITLIMNNMGIPVLDNDGGIYLLDNNNLWVPDAFLRGYHGTGAGLADAPWPRPHRNNRNTSLMPPEVPPNLAASDGAFTDGVRLTWQPAAIATSYRVLRGTNADPALAATLEPECPTPSYTDTSAVPGRVYFYWVRGQHHSGVSGYSASDTGWRHIMPAGYALGRQSDLAVFDQNTGYWYVYSLASGVVAWAQAWGWPGAKPVPGDYDGDNRCDLAVFDQNTGNWYVYSLSAGVMAWAQAWGWPGAEPVPGDYDGDGVSDLAVFDQNTGFWYVYSLGAGLVAWAQGWGWPGAEPVPGDYDGDSRSDLGVFDQNTGYWYVYSLASGQAIVWAQPWGWPGAEPVAGDYDGDARSDLAVFDQNTGNWYVYALASGQAIVWAQPWGWPGARPVWGDYNGDLVNDLAVFDSNTGYWYVYSLASGQAIVWAQPWGWPGAEPVPGSR